MDKKITNKIDYEKKFSAIINVKNIQELLPLKDQLVMLNQFDIANLCRTFFNRKDIESFKYIINLKNIHNEQFNSLIIFFISNTKEKCLFLDLMLNIDGFDYSIDNNFILKNISKNIQSSQIPKNIFSIKMSLFKKESVRQKLKINDNDQYNQLLAFETKTKLSNFN